MWRFSMIEELRVRNVLFSNIWIWLFFWLVPYMAAKCTQMIPFSQNMTHNLERLLTASYCYRCTCYCYWWRWVGRWRSPCGGATEATPWGAGNRPPSRYLPPHPGPWTAPTTSSTKPWVVSTAPSTSPTTPSRTWPPLSSPPCPSRLLHLSINIKSIR